MRAPVIKIIESERRLRNGRINTVTPIHHKSYTNLDYKPILSNNIKNIQVELKNETGKLVPFTGTGKVIVKNIFNRFQQCKDLEIMMDIMEHRRDIQSPLQSSDSQLCGLFCIYMVHYFYSEKFPFIPDVNELELLGFVKHMK